MRRLLGRFGSRRKLLSSVIGLLTFAWLMVFGYVIVPPSRAQWKTQNTAAAARAFEYAVASVKRSNPSFGDSVSSGMHLSPYGFTAMNSTLYDIITTAFGVANYQISGAPNWLDSERYDMGAEVNDITIGKLAQLKPDELTLVGQRMLQKLLEDRFKLTVHRETRELPLYTLVIEKNGPKLQESKPIDNSTNDIKGSGDGGGSENSMWVGREGEMNKLVCRAQSIADLAARLLQNLGSPVTDKTGLTGKYDFTLTWVSEKTRLRASLDGASSALPTGEPPDSSGPTLFEALRDQLGLKLEAEKGPVEIIVIDRIERHTGNYQRGEPK